MAEEVCNATDNTSRRLKTAAKSAKDNFRATADRCAIIRESIEQAEEDIAAVNVQLMQNRYVMLSFGLPHVTTRHDTLSRFLSLTTSLTSSLVQRKKQPSSKLYKRTSTPSPATQRSNRNHPPPQAHQAHQPTQKLQPQAQQHASSHYAPPSQHTTKPPHPPSPHPKPASKPTLRSAQHGQKTKQC